MNKESVQKLKDFGGVGITGDTRIRTDEGYKLVKNLVGRSFKTLVDGKFYTVKGFKKIGVKKVYELQTHSGIKIKATPDTEFKVQKRPGGAHRFMKLRDIDDGINLLRHSHDDGHSNFCAYSVKPAGMEMVYNYKSREVKAFEADGIYILR